MSWNSFTSVSTAIVGVLLGYGYYAQAWKMFKNQTAEGVSGQTMFIFQLASVVYLNFNVTYGTMPTIISSVFSLCGCTLALVGYLTYRR